ncbi:hypothetical protein SSX86_016477 [Deinandra increscens subsp. villosa]|uniref:Transposase-associated domain-containing protein n=1 Tax=Deinandra increscens subsp. villosa TaxID=3103831 RepID=A0AAP0D5H8_9ASTR
MDKSWMSSDRLSKAYDEGVNAFLEFAQSNNPESDLIRCPCVNCNNLWHHSIDSVSYHLFAHGFDEKYTVWSFHGEDPPMVEVRCPDESSRPEFDYTKEMLHDAFAYEEKEPDALKSLLEECDKPLYEGSTHNALSGLMIFQHLKGQFGWSDTSFDALLGALKTVLPAKNTIPSSMYEAKKMLKGIGLEYEKFHACENDCVLFWNEYKDASECPTCGTSRWKTNTKNVPRKVLWYFPPIPRFRRMFSSPEIAHDLTWHAQGRSNDGKLTHPSDSPSWKLVDNTWKEFGRESRNLRLALSADGINPHKSLSSKHSCWPVTLVTYNLPSYLCMSRKFMMLTLLISGPKQPGNNIDVYLAPLIADLKLLWETGVRTFDAYKKEYFNLRAILLWTINDFPACGNLSGCVTKGYNACPICSENTCSQWLPKSRKVCFLGHRKFLPSKHPFRKRKIDFNNEQESDVPKKPLSGEEIYDYLAGFENAWGQKIKSKTEKSKKKNPKKKNPKKKNPKKKKANFVLNPMGRKRSLQSVGSKWKNFKHTLYKKFILARKDDPEADLLTPPAMYPFLKEPDWKLFVAQHSSKHWEEKSKKAQKTRAKNRYNHRLSRKGYSGLIKELVKETSKEEEEIDRTTCWKKARQWKSGGFDLDVHKVVDKIEELEKQDKHEDVSCGTEDVLTQALGNEEQCGRVRGLDKFVSHQQYFHLPKTVKGYLDKEKKKINRRLRKVEDELERLTRGGRSATPVSEAASCQMGNDDEEAPEDDKEHDDVSS